MPDYSMPSWQTAAGNYGRMYAEEMAQGQQIGQARTAMILGALQAGKAQQQNAARLKLEQDAQANQFAQQKAYQDAYAKNIAAGQDPQTASFNAMVSSGAGFASSPAQPFTELPTPGQATPAPMPNTEPAPPTPPLPPGMTPPAGAATAPAPNAAPGTPAPAAPSATTPGPTAGTFFDDNGNLWRAGRPKRLGRMGNSVITIDPGTEPEIIKPTDRPTAYQQMEIDEKKAERLRKTAEDQQKDREFRDNTRLRAMQIAEHDPHILALMHDEEAAYKSYAEAARIGGKMAENAKAAWKEISDALKEATEDLSSDKRTSNGKPSRYSNEDEARKDGKKAGDKVYLEGVGLVELQ
jgi:hypothetical protein